MQIETTRFGAIQIPEEAQLDFPRGLYGLVGIRGYCLLPHDDLGAFQWLQATEAPAIAMVITDPFRFFPGYEVDIPDQAAELLQATAAGDVAIYTGITVAADRQQIFTNLLGPLVVNHRTGIGMQIIQDANRYSTRHLIPLPGRDGPPNDEEQRDDEQPTVARSSPLPPPARLGNPTPC